MCAFFALGETKLLKILIKNSKNKVTNTDKQHTEQEINLNTTNNT